MDIAGAFMREIPDAEHLYGEVAHIPVMTPEIVARAVAKKLGIPLDKITTSDKKKLQSLEADLNDQVLGQEDASKALSNAIRTARAGLNDPDKPIGSFLFRGPTGVGKTEMTQQLAEKLDVPIIRIDNFMYDL